MAHRVSSLYVHVPFCIGKCGYCAFYSEPASDELVDRFLDALARELALVAPDLAPKSVYVGGGTPTVLGLHRLERLFRELGRVITPCAADELTVECNPATVTSAKARLLRSLGVTRASLGVQSLDDELLSRLGRPHSRRQAFDAYEALRGAGFDNVNIDLMFAIPGQTMEMWRRTLAEVKAMRPEHLSCYEITYEEDTPLFELMGASESDANHELACAMYEELLDAAAAAGYIQYEVSNFALDAARSWGSAGAAAPAFATAAVLATPGVAERIPAYACKHNVNYWRGGEFFGLGPSAAGFVQGIHTANIADTRRYCALLEQGLRPIAFAELLPPLKRAAEVAAFGLRMVVGWSFEEFKSVTGYDLQKEWREEIAELVERGWGVTTPAGFRLTKEGLRFADAVAEMFLR
ncbi:MAG: coproporphyrinogen III oxidase family protein [Verrucomicrobiae bacterium]|nr:coproporphyrinogen III oxidase family protein [Verrucomicrobiae bacterium]